MNQIKINQWLKERHISCDESFAEALYQLAIAHKREFNCTLDVVWKELGITRQNIYYWRRYSNSTMTRFVSKYRVVEYAMRLFSLNESEAEKLANKAGLTRLGKIENGKAFSENFEEKLIKWKNKKSFLYENAEIDKRTFYRIKSGKHLRKEPILALLITMELTVPEIQHCLGLAGYCLSSSLPIDLLISYLLVHDLKEKSGFERLYVINHLLYELEQPLLEVRIGEK